MSPGPGSQAGHMVSPPGPHLAVASEGTGHLVGMRQGWGCPEASVGSQCPSLIGRWAWQGPTSPAAGGALPGDPGSGALPAVQGSHLPRTACFSSVMSWTSARSCPPGPGAQQDGYNLVHARLLPEPDTERGPPRGFLGSWTGSWLAELSALQGPPEMPSGLVRGQPTLVPSEMR